MALSVPIGNFSNFLGGALQEAGNERTKQDKIDELYQAQWAKVKPQEELDNSREANKQADIKTKAGAAINSDVVATTTQKYITAQQQGNVPLNVGGNNPPSSDSGGLVARSPSMETSNTAPVQGMGQIQQQQLPPAGGQAQPQTPQAVQQPQGGTNSAQGGPVSLPNASDQQPQAPTPPPSQPSTPPAQTPDQPPSQVPASSPAGQITLQHQALNAGQTLQQGGSGADAYISTITDPTVKATAQDIKNLYGIDDAGKLESALRTRAFDYAGDPRGFHKQMLSIAQLTNKESTNAPINRDNLGTDDSQHMAAMDAVGLSKSGSTLKPISNTEQTKVAKLVNDAASARQASKQGMDAVAQIAGATQDMSTGPLAEADSKMHAYLSGLTGSDLDAKYQQWWDANKATISLANTQMKSIGATRPGIQLALLEKNGVPSADMPPQAKVDMMINFYNQYRQQYNHADALMSGPSDYLHVADRQKFADKYDDENPALLGNGQSNPNMMDFNDWRTAKANGVQTTGITAQQLQKNQSEQLGNAKADVANGGTGRLNTPSASGNTGGWSIKKIGE